MSTFKITAVHTEPGANSTHEHIASVRINNTEITLSRETVVRDLRSPTGDRYFTEAKGKHARVIVTSCPHHCGSRDYITTEPDWTTENNLLSLPRF